MSRGYSDPPARPLLTVAPEPYIDPNPTGLIRCSNAGQPLVCGPLRDGWPATPDAFRDVLIGMARSAAAEKGPSQ
jgi:hypothetical protein